MIEFMQSLWDPDALNIHGLPRKFPQGERIAFQIPLQFDYLLMFPQCQIRLEFNQRPTFSVKKYWVQERDQAGKLRSVVMYLAQLPSATPPLYTVEMTYSHFIRFVEIGSPCLFARMI